MGQELGVIGQRSFCQVVRKDITAIMCSEMQGQEGCFGCAATSRLCESCKKKPVDVPAVGMCSGCLTRHLTQEEEVSQEKLQLQLRVDCQMMKRSIAVKMCLASQGQEGCRNCPASTRLCENCKKKKVRFKEYGLCLACSVEEYGDDWTPSSVSTSTTEDAKTTSDSGGAVADANGNLAKAVEDATADPSQVVRSSTMNLSGKDYRVTLRVVPRNGAAPAAALQPPVEVTSPKAEMAKLVVLATDVAAQHPRVSVRLLQQELGWGYVIAREVLDQMRHERIVNLNGEVLIPRRSQSDSGSPKDEAAADHCTKCGKPVWFKQIGMCRAHGTSYYRQKGAPQVGVPGKKLRKAEELFDKAKRLVLKHRRVSYSFLEKELDVSYPVAHHLLQLLESDSVIGPAIPRRSREILGEGSPSTQRSLPPPQTNVPLSEKIEVLRQLAEFFGKDSSTAKVVHEIVDDLGILRRMKKTLRKLGRE